MSRKRISLQTCKQTNIHQDKDKECYNIQPTIRNNKCVKPTKYEGSK